MAYTFRVKPASNALSSIVPGQRESWEGKWFLTFDIDFAIDEVIEDTIELLSEFNVRSTFFMTGATPLIEKIRTDRNIDVGIHPNFNPLLDGTLGENGSAAEVVGSLMSLFPEARSVRSHSLAQSSHLHQLFSDAGLTHDSNTLLPSGQVGASSPWVDWSGLTRVPYHWQDSLYFLLENTKHPEPSVTDLILTGDGFFVFNFHPIHVYLNTESLPRYEAARPFHHDFRRLSGLRNEGFGTRDRLLELLRSSE